MMKHIKVHHLTRVEGHGNLEARLVKGQKPEVRFSVVEAPRFFEVLLQGQDYREVTHIASRVCGICAVSHKCAALKATETAMHVSVSKQTEMLRRLAFHGEVLSSHILHIYFLAGPDYFGVPSIFPLWQSNGAMIKRAIRLKELGYSLCDSIAGRHTHPVGMTVGGFSFVPDESELQKLRERLENALEDLAETVRMFKEIRMPAFERKTEYVSLKHPDHYPFYDGELHSSEGETVSVQLYRDKIKERIESHSTAKYARWHLPEYMVGALSRFNNNFEQLSRSARQAAADLNLSAPCFNPFMNTVAQIVECIHCVDDSIELIDRLLEYKIHSAAAQTEFRPRAGRGVGAVEAPRGTLFHDFEYDHNGKCITANMVIPTAQNLANLEADLKAWLPELENTDEQGVTRNLEMLVRAYDPCISCSTH
ncbi:MAG: Ni/Fe hydrogenase subunit alpha [Desulfobacterales bacterium]